MSSPYSSDQESLQIEHLHSNDNNKVLLENEQSKNNLKDSQTDHIKSITNNEKFIPLNTKSYDNIKDTFKTGQIYLSTIPEELLLINENIGIDGDIPVPDVKNENIYLKNHDKKSLQFQITDTKVSDQVEEKNYNTDKDFTENKNLNVCSSDLLETNSCDSIPKINNILQDEQIHDNTFSDNILQNQSINDKVLLQTEETSNNIYNSSLSDKMNSVKNENSLETDNFFKVKETSGPGQICINKFENTSEIEGINDHVSPFNKLNSIESKESLETQVNSNIKDTLPINTICDINIKNEFLINDAIKFSTEKILEITNNLKDRDISLYEHIYFDNDDEEVLKVEQKNLDNANFCSHNQTNVTQHNNGDLINDENSLKIEKVPNILDISPSENTVVNNDKIYYSIVNEENVNNDYTLEFKENSFTKELNNKISESNNLENKTESEELALTVSDIESTLPKIETIGPVIKNETNLNSNKDLLESNNFEKINQKSISVNVKSTNGIKIPLENKKINFHNSITPSLNTKNKNMSIKEANIINKMQGMDWLKNRSSFNVLNMNHTSKLTLKSLPRKDQRNKDYFTAHENNRKYQSNTSAWIKDQNEIKSSDFSKQSNTQQQRNEQAKSTASTNAWNGNNAAKELFPKVESVVLDQGDEAEQLSKALAESICTAQQESEKRKLVEASLKFNIPDKLDNNYWGKVHKNLPENLSEATNSNLDPSCTKGFVDKFGRVDGYSEKRLFMGKGARKKEQEFLQAHTQNKVQSQNIQGCHQLKPMVIKSPTKSNFSLPPETKKESNSIQNKEKTENKNQRENSAKTETSLPNSAQEKFVHITSVKDINLPESNTSRSLHTKSDEKFEKSKSNLAENEKSKCNSAVHDKPIEAVELSAVKSDVSVDKNEPKSGFHHKMLKDVNQAYEENILKYNQDLIQKNQDNTGRNQNQNFSDKSQNQNLSDKSQNQNLSDKSQNQNFPNKSQNQNFPNSNQNQDFSNKSPNENLPNKSQNQNFSDRNQNQNFHNKSPIQNFPNKSLNQNFPNRNQNQNFPDRNQFQNFLDRSQNQKFPDRNQEYYKNHEHITRPKNYIRYQENIYKNQDNYGKLQNYFNRNYENLKKNQESYRNQHYPNRYQEFNTTSQYRHSKYSKDESLNEDQFRNSNLTFQKHSDNVSQQTYDCRRPKNQIQEIQSSNSFNRNRNSNFQEENKDITVETCKQINLKQENQRVDCNLGSDLLSDKSSSKTTKLASKVKEMNESKQNVLTSETSNVPGNLNSELKPNVTMTFEGNQNVQRALGLNPNTCNAIQDVNEMRKKDVTNSDVANAEISSTYVNTDVKNVQYFQSTMCENYDTSMPQMTNAVNVNVPPFNAINVNPKQVLNSPYSAGVDAIALNSDLGFYPNTDNDIAKQLRMNVISNSSHKLMKHYIKVSKLSKQLESAQADLFAAQVQMCQDAVNSQSLLALPIQNQSAHVDFLPINYPNPSYFHTCVPNVQKVQSDGYDLSNNFPTMNVQNIAPESFHSNALMDQRYNLQSIYIQQSNLYEQQPANFQQYGNVNAQTGNSAVPKERVVLQNNNEDDFISNENQFNSHQNI